MVCVIMTRKDVVICLSTVQEKKKKNFFQRSLEVISVLPGQVHSFLPVNRIVELTKIIAIYEVEYS